MKLDITNFSIRYPWIVILMVLILTVAFALQFPKVKFDNDPENMLSKDEYVRKFHNEVKHKYNLYDFVIVGIVNKSNKDGVFNRETLGRIYELTSELLSLKEGPEGKPVVTKRNYISGETDQVVIDLAPDSLWLRTLAVAFRHDPNRLFDENGESAIIGREIISPSLVDNIKQSGLGSLKLEYLMERPPVSRKEALVIRDDAMGNPLYKGTLVSEDGKAICIYIPIKEKTYSYNVASLVRKLTESWEGDDRVFITGQPVAQDTFGVEMLVQMAVSAPLAGFAIFLLLLLFFRRISLIVAPMLVAIISVVCAMGLLIGLGFDVHIMSSMIAIFLMPIAVADSVHILSEFFDLYHKFNDKGKTIRHVINHLFMPMLYTTLTTIAGFASLAVTPIPPVKVFGLHVAFGVALAWVLTITFVPAYIMVAVPDKMLKKLQGSKSGQAEKHGMLYAFLDKLGNIGFARYKLIITITFLVICISVFGITKINVNDNPVKWFTKKHPIRVSDKVLNSHFGGTYTAYLTLSSNDDRGYDYEKIRRVMIVKSEKRFGKVFPEANAVFIKKLNDIKNDKELDVNAYFLELVHTGEAIDKTITTQWNILADEINYLDPETLTYKLFVDKINDVNGVGAKEKNLLLEAFLNKKDISGNDLIDKALAYCEARTELSFKEFVFEMSTELTAPLFKRPEMLRYVERLQERLISSDVVGKTTSAVDALKKTAFELSYTPLADGLSESDKPLLIKKNESNRDVPDTVAAVGQIFVQLEGMKRKDSLFHLVTRDYKEANIWVQLKSGDNVDMESVVNNVAKFIQDNPPPVPLKIGWAGLTYLNVVWQDKMVRGMLYSLASSFIVVLIMMMVLFRSPLYGILSMIPLSVTITFIYGVIGLVGKDYDMPIAILSALTLGLSIDFAIHFLERAREEQKRFGNWKDACAEMFKEPAMAISRNAITISIGFTPLLAAPLVPYKTVGFFLATIMAVSWLATLFILPALLTILQKLVFNKENKGEI